jgi:hypothetical protein
VKLAVAAVAASAVVISLTGCTSGKADGCAEVAELTYKYTKLLDQATVTADRVRAGLPELEAAADELGGSVTAAGEEEEPAFSELQSAMASYNATLQETLDWLDTGSSFDAPEWERLTAEDDTRRADLVEAIADYELVCATTLDQSRLKLQ